jgi:maltose O-acetyltransferase
MDSEKSKMISGKPYFPFGKELNLERQHARDLVFEFNNLGPRENKKRKQIIKKLFGKTKKNYFLEPPFHCDYGYQIEIGENFFANFNFIVLDCAKVTIGDNVLIGPNVGIYTAGHPIHADKRNEGIEYAFPVSIGDNVWIGGHVVINPGITIGDNTVIASGSVVTKDIPANVIAMGNPCKVYREITEEDKLYYFKKLPFE